MDILEALGEERWVVLVLPESETGTAVQIAENLTGKRYGKVTAAAVVERPEGDVILLHDIGDCFTQVVAPHDSFGSPETP